MHLKQVAEKKNCVFSQQRCWWGMCGGAVVLMVCTGNTVFILGLFWGVSGNRWKYRITWYDHSLEMRVPSPSEQVSCYIHSWSQDVSVKEQVGVKGLGSGDLPVPHSGNAAGNICCIGPWHWKLLQYSTVGAQGHSAGLESFQLFTGWFWFGLCIRPSRKLRAFWGKVRPGSR